VTDVNVHATSVDSGAATSALRLPELQALASDLGIVGATKLRKGELVDAINEIQEQTAVKKRAPRRATMADAEARAAAAQLEEAAGASRRRRAAGQRWRRLCTALGRCTHRPQRIGSWVDG
jgi:transcription termination factor Rho